ncbi:aminoglycoside phosphotransferase [Burkholderia sp. Leaf177]|uniref:phosphotransferase enzyme family protein n=1 Tax=Burkholderia sp. Leaf177 TaxID=1736287 RepID=UPI0006F4A624|nr:phosphotransferase [Burkholderia sp. Leaf177]KQR78957.1 aminoglycoside phosphotransferase [Burkholderia sp. Leaf177]
MSTAKTPPPGESSTEFAPLQFGVDGEQAERDWPLITREEAEAVFEQFPFIGAVTGLTWHSPRPFSAAVLIDTSSGDTLFMKRHHASIRDVQGLAEEHAFIAHLASHGLPVADILATPDGDTAVVRGEWTYEVHRAAAGVDVYRKAMSWTPFADTSHAFAAGHMLARLHVAAQDFAAPARPIRPLLSSFRALNDAGLIDALDRWIGAQPSLLNALQGRDWRSDVTRVILPWHARLAPLLPALRPLWTHGDWHASNLLWTSDTPGARVSTILDFGLSDRTCAVYDLAVAIERNAIEWLSAQDARQVHLDHVDALLNGYESRTPLSDDEYAALVAILPIVHTEFALSEVAYFHATLGSQQNADVAYDGYLLGHAQWFSEPAGKALIDHLETRERIFRATV